MIPERLRLGDTIGIISPSHAAVKEQYAPMLYELRRLGFKVKEGANLYKTTDGYMASAQERADDLNAMIADPEVKLILFGGGEAGCEAVPLIDFEAIRRHPKLLLSYSDSTTILCDIYMQTGLTTYYGQSVGTFGDLRAYDWEQFAAHIMRMDAARHVSAAPWRVQTRGTARGRLIGGYAGNFALMVNDRYFRVAPDEKYILFLEDHEKFGPVSRVSALLSVIEQSAFINQVSGLLFGHFSRDEQPDLYARIRRFGQAHGIPSAYCDDFGHGVHHAIFPYGAMAELDTTGEGELRYL